ncbi:MAG: hypothetical protein JWQ01_4970 [Massilia sp.]|nr:hypothetical protein [Massilia sp.]
MNRTLKPLVALLAAIYFLVDAVFLPVAGRISDWVATHWALHWLRDWIVSLRPYPTLLLFAVPVIVLEPVKPLALYLVGTGRVACGAMVFVVGELLKLVLVERLFSISCDKLMMIPAFAWSYGRYRQAKDWVTSSGAWQNMVRYSRFVQYTVRRYVRELRISRNPRRLSAQSR